MIIDGETVFTGSFNFARAAKEKNAENLFVIRDKFLAARYTGIWQDSLAFGGLHQPQFLTILTIEFSSFIKFNRTQIFADNHR